METVGSKLCDHFKQVHRVHMLMSYCFIHIKGGRSKVYEMIQRTRLTFYYFHYDLL